MSKIVLKIDTSSYRVWVWLDGDKTKEPIRGYADAIGVVHSGTKQIEKGESFEGWKDIPYNCKAIVEARDGWDGYFEKPTVFKTSPYEINVKYINNDKT